MSGLTLTVHRATNQIGGNCIELATADGRVLLDVGRPLDAPKEATGLLPKTLDLSRPVDGVLISHPHQDHYGLLDELPASWPVYSGASAGKLMHMTASIFGTAPVRDYRHWSGGEAIEVGPFRITPHLTDHSAFDAYMLLIEAAEKRVLYSGDFRRHGRKSALVDRLMSEPPPDVDVLLMEGTNLGSDKPTKSERDLEEDFVALFNETPGRVFTCWSAQNIDRTVTLYRAAVKSGRTLVIDLYTAEVLELLADAGKLPRAGWNNVKVVITRSFARLYEMKGRKAFVERMAAHGISAAALAQNPGKWVVMIRPSLIRDFVSKGVVPTAGDAWSYSQWRGYLDQPDGVTLKAWFDQGGSRPVHLHTSGHASIADLKAFAAAISARAFVPIHGVAWDGDRAGFNNIVRLTDGEPMMIA
ncbi:MBL fold metallo-hydrolase [Brevundimonas sp.]|uniref:MBL fold metallo-hydrolase n=1 Tax=Brevundimonas sp. TaxID=1871086 RepID=UPI00289CFF4B|nr:MBL fold metallo-hydrolase [Brevundimonas sp.]